MSADRELLELAAKAHGGINEASIPGHPDCDGYVGVWDPLTDDGDALRLAVKLHMTVRCYMGTTVAQIGVPGQKNAYEEATDHADPGAATRRAIVRAAAEIGKAMQ